MALDTARLLESTLGVLLIVTTSAAPLRLEIRTHIITDNVTVGGVAEVEGRGETCEVALKEGKNCELRYAEACLCKGL